MVDAGGFEPPGSQDLITLILIRLILNPTLNETKTKL
jgi:hypothetical protein